MIDTVEFVLHEVNGRQFDILSPLGTSFKNSYNQVIYERLMEYESIYIERTKDFKAYQELQNPDGSDFKRREVGFNSVLSSRSGGVHSTSKGSEIYFHRVRGKISTASSDYRVNFSISENADAITFNLSIPKYLYGSNVAQFVPQVYSDRYQQRLYTMRFFRTQLDFLNERLVEFIYTFFDDLSIYINLPDISNLDMSKIEIKRLDFCYNQYFLSEVMAQDYIIAQKKFYNTKIKKNSLVGNETDTSLYYRHSTDGFYFKIYMKGAEFINNDLPRLLKENEDYFDASWFHKSKDYVDIFKKHFPTTYTNLSGRVQDKIFAYYKSYIDSNENEYIAYVNDLEKLLKVKLRYLLTESKRILRYEMSFTRTYMSTLFKRELYRRNCKNWKILKGNYDKIKRYDLLISQGKVNQAETYKKRNMVDYTALFRYSTDKETAIYTDRRMSTIRKDYDTIHRSQAKKHEFYLKTSNDVKSSETFLSDLEFSQHRNNKRYKIYEQKEATLTKDLLKLMSDMFESEILYFQVKEVEESITILDQLTTYNEKAELRRLNYIKNYGEENYKKLTHTQKRKKELVKISKTKLKPVIDKLEKGQALKDIFENLGITKSQQYIYESDLKKFNIHRQSVKRTFSSFKPKTDFSTYYERFFTEKQHDRILFNPAMISFDTIRNNRQ